LEYQRGHRQKNWLSSLNEIRKKELGAALRRHIAQEKKRKKVIWEGQK